MRGRGNTHPKFIKESEICTIKTSDMTFPTIFFILFMTVLIYFVFFNS